MEPTLVSTAGGNAKVGPCVANTYREVGQTCPAECTLKDICYAAKGRCNMVQLRAGRLDPETQPLEQASSVPLIRHLTSGDCYTTKGKRTYVDKDFVEHLIEWHNRPSQRYTIGWGYTHGAERLQAAGYGPDAFPANLTMLASCEDLPRAKRLQAAGWQTARVIDEPEEKQPNETLCP